MESWDDSCLVVVIGYIDVNVDELWNDEMIIYGCNCNKKDTSQHIYIPALYLTLVPSPI